MLTKLTSVAVAATLAISLLVRLARRKRHPPSDDLESAIQSALPPRRSGFPIAVVDDRAPQLFPEHIRQSLRNKGFRIEYFEDVKSIDEVKGFPIIFCDVQGVGSALALEGTGHGGLIVKDLRIYRPMAYIVMYSMAANYDPAFNRYWELADESATLESLSGEQFGESLDRILGILGSPPKQWQRFNRFVLNRIPEEMTPRKLGKLENAFLRMSREQCAALDQMWVGGHRIGAEETQDGSSADTLVQIAELVEKVAEFMGS